MESLGKIGFYAMKGLELNLESKKIILKLIEEIKKKEINSIKKITCRLEDFYKKLNVDFDQEFKQEYKNVSLIKKRNLFTT